MHYATDNIYGSSTSVGFSNTWRVFAFATKASRDAFVKDGNMSARAVKRKDIPDYLREVKPFSGEAICLDRYATHDIEGCIGQVCVAIPDKYQGTEKLRK